MLTGQNGILNRASEAKNKTTDAQNKEELEFALSQMAMEYHLNGGAATFSDYIFAHEDDLKAALGTSNVSLNSEAKTITYKKPEIKYYSNLTGAELTDFSDMADILAKHIVSPVRFTSELAAMAADGFDTFVEFGPNKVLTGLVKKTFKGVKAFNIENCKNLEEAFS